jgi:hypothetical protein
MEDVDDLIKKYHGKVHTFRYSEVPIYEPWLERLKEKEATPDEL